MDEVFARDFVEAYAKTLGIVVASLPEETQVRVSRFMEWIVSLPDDIQREALQSMWREIRLASPRRTIQLRDKEADGEEEEWIKE